jgi:hypothetical protein
MHWESTAHAASNQRRIEMALATATATKPVKAPKPLPAPNSDFYQLADVLTAEEKAIVKKLRTYMETKVQPVINKYWSDDVSLRAAAFDQGAGYRRSRL